MDHHMDIDEEDLEPTPLALPHQLVHRAVSQSPATYYTNKRTAGNTLLTDPIISDSDGAGDVEEEDDEDDDFHSVTSQDEFHIVPENTDVIFGRGQPLRDHPGNMRMRDIIKRYTSEYRNGNKSQKTKILKLIQDAIAGNGTRFLLPYNTQQPLEGCKLATQTEIRGKISHGLRDAIKVEDLLDSEFVQLWSTQAATCTPPHVPPIPPHVVSPSPNFGMANMPFHPVNDGVVNSAIPSPMSFQSSSNITQPPPFSLGQQRPLMNLDQQQAMMLLQQQGLAMNAMQALPYGNQSMNSYLTQPDLRSNLGPAIFHITTNLPTDKTEDDDSTLETAEKGLSPNRDQVPSATPVAVDAVLASTIGPCSSKQNISLWAVGIVVVIVLVVLVILGFMDDDEAIHRQMPTNSPTKVNDLVVSTLQNVIAKGFLTCAVASQPGYAARNATTNIVEGFEVDLCRAISAAIFGRELFMQESRSNEPVKYVFVEPMKRFEVLASGEVDILLGATTANYQRQLFEPSTKQSFAFSTPYLINGLIFGGRPEYLECADTLNLTETCQDSLTVCVLRESTHVDVVKELLPSASIVEAPTYDAHLQIYLDGGCNVIAGEQLDVARIDSMLADYEVGSAVHSKEPLAIVTRTDDVQFSDFINWVLQSIIAAEELRDNTGSIADLPTHAYFGDRHELMFHDAVAVVSDYGALYLRHLEPYYPRSDVNRINVNTGAMFALPFGNLSPSMLPTVSGGTLSVIRERGYLKCGISNLAIFAELDPVKNEWTGLDVDFCKALSAAIFDGAVYVRYDVLSPSERFLSLHQGEVDVLARETTYTLERDVQEPSTGSGFTFSPPNFFDSIRFAGIPEFVACAELLDYESDSCRDLVTCVTQGTTQHQILKSSLPDKNIRLTSETSATLEDFVEGRCNTMFGGMASVAPASVIALGYTGEYETSMTSFSRESLSLVTREDDVTWSNFVELIVTATIYADEHGITQASYLEMPRVDLFHPLIGNEMLRHAIRQVGSYAEIWDRNAASTGLEREGRNMLNALPYLGPQLISDLLWDQIAMASR